MWERHSWKLTIIWAAFLFLVIGYAINEAFFW